MAGPAGFGRDAERQAAAAAEAARLAAEAAAAQAEFNKLLDDSRDLAADLNNLSENAIKNKEKSSDITKQILAGDKKIAELEKKIAEATGTQKTQLEEVKKAIEDEQKGLKEANETIIKAEGYVKKLKGKFEELGKAVADGYVSGLLDADQQIAETGRNLGLSREEVIGLRQEFAAVADASGQIAINATRLLEANNQLNDQLGTAIKFSGETAATFSKLVKIPGITEESVANLAFAAEVAGENFREIEENALATSYELQRASGINLSNKKVLEAIGKVTGQARANFAANPNLIATAVTKAKLLGAELDDIVAASKQLLDFESSIEAELEAELLTGKQLNLERARAAALAGDQATLADELAKNIGTFAEFSDMNVLQQDALAKSMGMSSDQLSDMLFKQETMGMNAEQLRAIGKDELADQIEQQSLAESRALAQEKFANALADTAMVLMPVVDFFREIYQTLFGSREILSIIVGLATTLGAALLLSRIQMAYAARESIMLSVRLAASAISSIFTSFGGLPFGLGIPLAIGAAATFMSLKRSASTEAKAMYQGGIVKPRAGGTPAIIGEAGQPEAVIPLNKAQQMGFGGGNSSPQPIIINNTWDAFAASSGRGRKGLGGTQELQASPTFV